MDINTMNPILMEEIGKALQAAGKRMQEGSGKVYPHGSKALAEAVDKNTSSPKMAPTLEPSEATTLKYEAECYPTEPSASEAPLPHHTPEDAGTSPEGQPDEFGSGVDADGLPWDGRIHASTKTKIKNCTWKAKRGVDAETVATVTAELREQFPKPEPEPVHTDAEGRQLPPATEVFPSQTVDLQDAPPVPPSVAPVPYTFVSYLQESCKAVQSGSVTQGAMDAVHAAVFADYGVDSIQDLQTKPDAVAPIREDERIVALLGSR